MVAFVKNRASHKSVLVHSSNYFSASHVIPSHLILPPAALLQTPVLAPIDLQAALAKLSLAVWSAKFLWQTEPQMPASYTSTLPF
jgi:hypothetical protein